MEFQIVHGRIGSDIWANTRLKTVRRLIKSGGKTILDLGCGKGYVGSALSKGNKVIFAEIDESLIKDVKGMKVILDANHIPFKQETFDYVICADVLEHIKDDKKILGNIHSVLKKGGGAVIAVPAYAWLYGHHDRILKHYRRYNLSDFRRLAKNAGFKIKSVRYTCSLLLFPFLINQGVIRSNKAYEGKSRIEGRITPLLNFFAWVESSLRLPFGINLQFVLEK